MDKTRYNYSGKRALAVGMGKSGNAVVRFLFELECLVDIYDDNPAPDFEEGTLNKVNESFIGGKQPKLKDYDLIVIAPGVPLNISIIDKAKKLGIEIIGEVELAYRFAEGSFVGITGTNGKTTTSTWIHHAFLLDGKKSYLAGNVGIPLTDMVRKHDSKSVFYITELSSYQLETIKTFKPVVATILNITPDHLKRHGNMDNYLAAKLNIQNNMEDKSTLILNFDDAVLSELINQNKGYSRFSKNNIKSLVYVKDDFIYSTIYKNEPILNVKEIFLKGEHNLENALALCAVSSLCGISVESLRESLKTFKGVAHRNEYVVTVNGIDCYNDSKATNPEASIPALKSINTPILLIAGGMDKGNDYAEWISYFSKVKKVFLFGETKNDIAKALLSAGYTEYELFENLDEAFYSARNYAITGDTILLSPACASWDMYKNFEERGEHFKRLSLEWFTSFNNIK